MNRGELKTLENGNSKGMHVFDLVWAASSLKQKDSKKLRLGVSYSQMRSFSHWLRIHAVSTSSSAWLFSMLLFLSPVSGNGQEATSLMTMIRRWQYPGSKISGATAMDAATVNAAGERTRPSFQYRAVLTTKDPMAKVIAYYESKLKPFGASKPAESEEQASRDSGQSVTFEDDSQDRPVAIHVICVNSEKKMVADRIGAVVIASTSLVISRATTESETHIAWAYYEKD